MKRIRTKAGIVVSQDEPRINSKFEEAAIVRSAMFECPGQWQSVTVPCAFREPLFVF